MQVSPRYRGQAGAGEQQTQRWPWDAALLLWRQEHHLVRGSLQHQELPAERGREVSIGQEEGSSGQGKNGHADSIDMGLATAYLTSRLARGSSQSRGAHGTRGATFTTWSRRTLFARFTLK